LLYTYSYDRYGNKWNQELDGLCTAGTSYCITFDNNNRINSGAQTYDSAGNVIQDAFHHYYYDAENRLIQVDGTLGTCTGATTACYVYDAEGRRVQKTTVTGTVNFVYEIAGQQVAEVNSSGALDRAEVYAGGRHLATYTISATCFDHGDWLGTERARSGVNGLVCETITSLPFGDGMNTSGSCSDSSPMHFTSKQRDGESGADFFGARYFGSGLGRWLSPDPSMRGEILDLPQSWNKYNYEYNRVPVPKVKDLGELNAYSRKCRQEDEQRRIRGKPHTVGEAMRIEREHLLPLNGEGFELAETSFPVVDGQGCVKVRTNRYSVPLRAGSRTQVRLLPAYVEVSHEQSCVARHERNFGRHRITLNRMAKSNVGTDHSKGSASGLARRCRSKMPGGWFSVM